MKNKSIEEILEYAYKVMTIGEFEELMKNDNVKAYKFAGSCYIENDKYPIPKHLVLLKNGESLYIYKDMPCL